MSFPEVTLDTPYIAQKPYQSSEVFTLQIEDDVAGRTLRAFCQLGADPSFKYWVPVLSGDSYTVDWTNDTVSAAITTYFTNPTP
jgi:hypothetical protein